MFKKLLLAVSLATLTTGAIAASAGLELDTKINANGGASQGSGAKLFVGFENGFGASVKRGTDSNVEINVGYTLDLGSVWLKGEVERVLVSNGADVNKAGIGAGTVIAGVDLNTRLRQDVTMGSGSNVSRIDLGAGYQVTESAYVKANIVNQFQNDASSWTANQEINNLELRATFNNIDGFTPFFEIGDEGNFRNDSRNQYGKVGIVLPF